MKQISIRERFDNLYACLEVCMNHLSEPESFPTICVAISIEAGALESELSQLLEQYKKRLPVRSEEPEGVDWYQEQTSMQKMIDRIVAHEMMRCQNVLFDKLNDLLDLIVKIDEALIPEENADIYADYSKRELAQYSSSSQWNSVLRTLRSEMVNILSSDKTGFFARQKTRWLEDLCALAPFAVDVNELIVYHEGLGRKLWSCRDDNDEYFAVLRCVKSYVYYCMRLGEEPNYLDRKFSEDELKQPEIQTEINIQKAFQNGTFGYAMITCSFDRYGAQYDKKWVVRFWEDLAQSKIAGHIGNRLTADSQKWKVLCQIIGELKTKGVLTGSDSDIAGAMREQNKSIPCSRETIIDYLRHSFTEEKKLTTKRATENKEISAWIQGYKQNEA